MPMKRHQTENKLQQKWQENSTKRKSFQFRKSFFMVVKPRAGTKSVCVCACNSKFILQVVVNDGRRCTKRTQEITSNLAIHLKSMYYTCFNSEETYNK